MSRIPPGLRISATLGEASALNWLSQDIFFGVEKFGQVTNYASADGLVTVWSGGDSALNSDPYYPENVSGMQQEIGGALGIARTLYVYTPQAAVTGANIVVQGLDANGNMQTGYATTNGINGQTPVELLDADGGSITWTRSHRAWIESYSGGAVSTDVIYISNDNAPVAGVPGLNATWAMIRNTATLQPNQTFMAHYTVPLGHRAVIKGYSWSLNKQGTPQVREGNFQLQTRNTGLLFRTRHLTGAGSNGTSAGQHLFPTGISCPELTDIRIMVIADTDALDFTATFAVFVKKR